MNRKRCLYCGGWYAPDQRTARFQQACPKKACRRQRKRMADRRWRQRNPDCIAARQPKIRQWARDFPQYWKRYRAAHPAYRLKERQRMRRQRVLRVAKQDAIRQNPVGYLSDIRSLPLKTVAKHDAMGSQIDGILDYLVAGTLVAKPNAIAPGRSSPLP